TAATAATAGGCTATAVPEAAPCKVSATVVPAVTPGCSATAVTAGSASSMATAATAAPAGR
ncbi:PE family protein, partial [Mycobacterium tuberculosis]